MNALSRSPVLVLIAFLATLGAYVAIAVLDAGGTRSLDTLEAALLICVGALAGVAVPNRPSAP